MFPLVDVLSSKVFNAVWWVALDPLSKITLDHSPKKERILKITGPKNRYFSLDSVTNLMKNFDETTEK